MLKSTAWDGRYLTAGSEQDIASDIASRWVIRKIAEVVEPEKLEKSPAKVKADPITDALVNMTVSELTDLAESMGIEIPTKAKKKELIALIRGE